MNPPAILITFAVKEESAPFLHRAGRRPGLQVLLTGIGPRNADKTIRRALAGMTPGLVLTCGFAGALNQGLAVGTVIFSADDKTGLSSILQRAGARPATIHCADRVAVTAAEKRVLFDKTGADAVEMESGVIRSICDEHNIPAATVRVISDAAGEDLPLDFNRLLDGRQNLQYGKLALALAGAPWKIAPLLRLRKQTGAAAEKLARVLVAVIRERAEPGGIRERR